MVNMIGFHHKEPRYNTAMAGQQGFFIARRNLPTDQHPERARLHSPTAHAVFTDAEHARLYLEHPGTLPHLSRAYLTGNTTVCGACWWPEPCECDNGQPALIEVNAA